MKNQFVKSLQAIPLSIVLIGVAAYLGFSPLFEIFKQGAIKELLAAIFGAVMISFITLFQLRRQTELGDLKDKDSIIFEEKLSIFNEYLQAIEGMAGRIQVSDESYSDKEKTEDITKAIFLLSKLRMHCGSSAVDKVGFNLLKTLETGKNSGDPEKYLRIMVDHMFATCKVFRSELFPTEADLLDTKFYGDRVTGVTESMKGLHEVFFLSEVADSISTNHSSAEQTAGTYYYANLGGRPWNDMRTYGFWQAGGSDRIISGMRKIKVGDILCAYASRYGYVAVGEVMGELTAFNEMRVRSPQTGDDVYLKDVTTAAFTAEQLELEYCIPVRWRAGAKKMEQDGESFPGIFAAPMTLCRLRDEETLEFLNKQFPAEL